MNRTTFLAGRVLSGLAALLFLLFVHVDCGLGQGLEPEESIWAGFGESPLYYGVLREALLSDHPYRMCGTLVIPSSPVERAVFMVRSESGKFSVVSRKLKEHLWTNKEIQKEYQAPARDRVRLGTEAREILQKLRVGVDTSTAELDSEAANALSEICKQVLLRVRYPEVPHGGLDGVTYHVGHWIPGAFLSGRTWSPEPDTLAGKFIAMEEALSAYAEATPAQRATARKNLLTKATTVSAALKTP